MFCLSYGVFNNGMSDYPNKRSEFSFSLLILSNLITVLFSMLFFIIFPFIKDILGMDYPLAILMCVLFFFEPAYNMWFTREKFEYKFKYVVIVSIVLALLSSITPILLILICNDSNKLYLRIFGSQIPLITIYILFYYHFWSSNNYSFKTQYWKAAFLFNLPLIPHYLSIYVLNSSDKIMISNLIGNTPTAFYSIAHSVSGVSLIIWTAANSSLVPFTYNKCKSNDYDSINQVSMALLYCFLFVCISVVLFAPEIIFLMAPSDYYDSVYVVPPLVCGVFFQAQYYMYANIIYYHKKPNYVMYGSLSATFFNLLLNYIFIKRFGYIAAGYTTLFCYSLQAFVDFYFLKRVVNQPVFSFKKIFLVSLLFVSFSLFCSIIYSFFIFRYFIAIIFLILSFYVFKSKLLSSLRLFS